MKKQVRIISTLLICVIVVISAQTATSADMLQNSDNQLTTEDPDEPDSDMTLVHTINDDQMHELIIKLRMIAVTKQTHEMADQLRVEQETGQASLVEYIDELTGLGKDTATYLIKQSEELGLDPFIILAIIRVESNFNPHTVGALGERGLGQLMANTAEPVAARLGIDHDPDRLFEPEYNILLFTTQFKYLSDFYGGDFHKTLTAYNRGQYGLEKYIASRSSHVNPEVSDYSLMIYDFASTYKYGFDNQ
ncbi:MAG: transglycosylase SLT domain-containing protein [Dethiosulfatibacter sp.]|nr:transglycosylase SLT domain-containing protein [Dethiosulfatibacter sp.]